jgi:rSAM/selenodomain-associated transferase 2
MRNDQATPQLSIVIPALNDASALERVLRFLAAQSASADDVEVLVADGGSQDPTSEVAARLGATVISTRPGRGLQLNAGCMAARGTWLWLLHADCLPTAAAMREMFARAGVASNTSAPELRRASAIGWGRFAVCFDEDSLRMRLTAALMNGRSRLTGICTGDQGIFLHRRLLRRIGGIPEQPLMEDVELCRRLKTLCRPYCATSRVQTSSRRWRRAGWLKTVLTMWRFRLRYWLGTPADSLAREYYTGS